MGEAVSVIRIEADGLIEVLNRFLAAPLAKVGTGAIIERSGQNAGL
jgi:hypothetical protein